MKKKFILAALSMAAMMTAGSAFAATKTATMNVSLTNMASVTVTATAISFGRAIASRNNITGLGNITVNASSGLPYKISINGGLHPTVKGTCRHLYNGATSVRGYKLYKDSGRLTTWGDSDFAKSCGTGLAGGGSSKSAKGTGLGQANAVYAKAFKGGTLIGALSDTLTVTVNY